MKAKVIKRFIDRTTVKKGNMTKDTKTYEPDDVIECTEVRFKELFAGKYIEAVEDQKGEITSNGK